MALFSAMTFAGPALGPVTSGFLELTEDWRYAVPTSRFFDCGMLIVYDIAGTSMNCFGLPPLLWYYLSRFPRLYHPRSSPTRRSVSARRARLVSSMSSHLRKPRARRFVASSRSPSPDHGSFSSTLSLSPLQSILASSTHCSTCCSPSSKWPDGSFA